MANEALFDVSGKTVLITGGSRGIGLMMARGFVAGGARVFITSRKAAVCDEAAAGLSGPGLSGAGECISLPADLSRLEEVERVIGAIRDDGGRLDVLINNAGTSWGAVIGEFPEKGWDKVMDLNLKSPFFLVQSALPLLEAAGTPEHPARVINVTSADGLHTPLFENFSYAASKAALNHLTRMLAERLASRHITVNAIAPGPFLTEMMQPMVEQMGEDTILANVPLKRMGVQEDAAGAAIFLSSRAGAYVTGVVLSVDGGLVGGS